MSMGKKNKNKTSKGLEAVLADPERRANLAVISGPSGLNLSEDQLDDLKQTLESNGSFLCVVKRCTACDTKLQQPEFFLNHWQYMLPEHRHCIKCVIAGKYTLGPDPEKPWVGQTKPPVQIMYERGWVKRDDPSTQGGAGLGKLIMGMPDAEQLLAHFEYYGFYGYGGIHEGLCLYPGCTEGTVPELDRKLSKCGRCKQARYCSTEHQHEHWRFHKKCCTPL